MKKLLCSLLFAGAAYAQPSNNECAGAALLPVNEALVCETTVEIDVTGATFSGTPSGCTEFSEYDVWFRFTATSATHKITYANVSGFEASLQSILFSGSCGNLTPVGCLPGNGLMNNLTVGETYLIQTHADLGTTGTPDTVFTACVTTPLPAITTSATAYTAEELVNDVLINSQCVNVSNISFSTATSATFAGGLGYFNANGSAFQFSEGVVLSTGSVNYAPGPNNGPSSSNYENWGTDADLAAIMATNGYNGNFYNATVLEFDFVPLIDFISFEFLFASKEYGTFQCGFADAFAFILTDVASGEQSNLAVIPGTTIPVSVVTIRDNLYNPSCSSVNPQFFDSFYTAQDVTAPVNFNGVTVPMTASGLVTPGNTYHIKLVIADYFDTAFDSAVFLEAGSFNIGAPDEAELSSSTGTILCEGAETTLSINLPESFNFSWFHNGVQISGATGSSITVSEPGEYSVNVAFTDSACNLNYSVNILPSTDTPQEFGISPYVVFEANSDGSYTFNLNNKINQIKDVVNAGDAIITLHPMEIDAISGSNAFGNTYTNSANPELIYVRIENPVTGCFTIAAFYLVVLDENYTTPPPSGADNQLFGEGDTLEDIEMEGENIQWYANDATGGRSAQDADDEEEQPLPMSTLLVDGTTYYATQTVWGIESVERTPVTVHFSLGTAQPELAFVKVYPNPVNNVLYINNKTDITSVSVYNLLGQEMITTKVDNPSAAISFAALNQGVYLVKVTSKNTERTIKVVKQ